MCKRDKLRKLLAGEPIDRPPVGCWYHFPPESQAPQAAAQAHLQHLEKFDLDFLKIMNDMGYPRESLGASRTVRNVEDLRRIRTLPGDTHPFNHQLELIALLKQRVGGQVGMTTTVFHAWMVLRKLTVPPPKSHGPPVIDIQDNSRDALLTQWLREDRPAVSAALQAIGRTLSNFTRACMETGADGIYLATRDDWVDSPGNRAALSESGDAANLDAYGELVSPTDQAILSAAASGWFNVLHLCGRPIRFDRHLSNENVHVLHWSDRVTGPTIADARKVAESESCASRSRRLVFAAGVDNQETLPRGGPDQVASEVREAVASAAGHPLIITPGCTFDPAVVPDENIHALVTAARRVTPGQG